MTRWTPARIASLAAGLLAYALIAFLDSPLKHQGELGDRPAYAAAATALMAIWWLTEAVPIYVTALVPVVLFPATGVFGGDFANNVKESLLPYVDGYIFLFMGGMCIAAAMQQWNLHRRIALNIMRIVGTDPQRLLLGFLAATAFISLWISNTATAAMMLPIGIAVIRQFESRLEGKRLANYGAAIMLSIAYASNVGGIGTKIGTAPNAQLAQFMSVHGVEITFVKFAAVGLPFVVLFIPLIWLVLWRLGRTDPLAIDVGAEAVRDELDKLGPTKRGELVVLVVFLLTAAVWIIGKPLTETLKSALPFKVTTAYVEGGTAMLATLALALIRVEGRQALELRSLRGQPWETLILLGGSFSMAEAIQKSGLSVWVGSQLSVLRGMPPFVQTLLACVVTVALSAVASNTATTSVMLNVLKDAVSPEVMKTVLFAATISASCDFALPAGTPPNAIVFASGYLTIPRMAKTGIVLDVAAAIAASIWCWAIVRFVL
jgi:solute carrier family 13 (sodium-dependent dicarboxylate transporter), member 2/3/5